MWTTTRVVPGEASATVTENCILKLCLLLELLIDLRDEVESTHPQALSRTVHSSWGCARLCWPWGWERECSPVFMGSEEPNHLSSCGCLQRLHQQKALVRAPARSGTQAPLTPVWEAAS